MGIYALNISICRCPPISYGRMGLNISSMCKYTIPKMNDAEFDLMFETSYHVNYTSVDPKNVICRPLSFSKSTSRNQATHNNIDINSLHERWKTANEIVIFSEAVGVGAKFK